MDEILSQETQNTEQQSLSQTTTPQWALFLGTALFLIVLDQITKALIVANLQLYETWVPFSFLDSVFDITYTRNTGAAFGLFQSASNLFFVVAILASAVIIYYYRQIQGRALLMRLAMGLQLAGALGNAIDRVTRGYVVDFLHVFYEPVGFDFPIFNIADSSIVIGVLLLILLLSREDDSTQDEVTESG